MNIRSNSTIIFLLCLSLIDRRGLINAETEVVPPVPIGPDATERGLNTAVAAGQGYGAVDQREVNYTYTVLVHCKAVEQSFF